MEKLIVPKHTADLDYIMSAIKIYYDADVLIANMEKILALNEDTDNNSVKPKTDIIPTTDKYAFLNSCLKKLYSTAKSKRKIANNPKYAPRHPV